MKVNNNRIAWGFAALAFAACGNLLLDTPEISHRPFPFQNQQSSLLKEEYPALSGTVNGSLTTEIGVVTSGARDGASQKTQTLRKVIDSQIDRQEHLIYKSRQLPAYGTPQFDRDCSWAAQNYNPLHNCTIPAQPTNRSNEGLSNWVSVVVSGYLQALQTKCHFSVSFGTAVNLTTVLIPRSAELDWRVTENVECVMENGCLYAESAYARGGGPNLRKLLLSPPFLAQIPSFRNAYGDGKFIYPPVKGGSTGLRKTLNDPNFNLTKSMGCVFETLFTWSPTFRPAIMETLSKVKDKVMLTLYIRTGHTEHVNHAEAERVLQSYRTNAQSIVDCALQIEQQQFADEEEVLWLLITDSPYIRAWLQERYNSTRTILTTTSRGAHTKLKNNQPSTIDFAEAFLDWYLIGEGDVVISDRVAPSFGKTATFRTVRPYIKANLDNGTLSCTSISAV